MSISRWAKILKNKRVLVPGIVVAGILILAGAYYVWFHPKYADSSIVDQPLISHGLKLSVSIESLNPEAGDKTMISGGDTVRVTTKLENTSPQRSRFLTVKTGLFDENFSYVHNMKGFSGITAKDGEIAFENVVMEPQQSQEISFEAIAHGFDNQTFEIKPTLIDTTGKIALTGNTTKYSVSPGQLQGGTVQITSKGE